MNVVFICQAVDVDDPIQGTVVRWIEVLARKSAIRHVYVIALRSGRHVLPENVSVHTIKRRYRPFTAIAFYRYVIKAIAQRQADCFFVHQGGHYPGLLWPLKVLLNKKVYQWKAHPYISAWMRCYARFCSDVIFTSTPGGFPMKLAHRRVVGQGVNLKRFTPEDGAKTLDLVTIGRVSPIKRLELMVAAVARCRRQFRSTYRLEIYGGLGLASDAAYRDSVLRLARQLGIGDQVELKGPVSQDRIPSILNRARAFLFCCRGALGRSVVEAMACGVPVISCNACVAEALPEEYRGMLVCEATEEGLAERIHQVLSYDAAALKRIGAGLREVACQSHGDEELFDRIVMEILARN